MPPSGQAGRAMPVPFPRLIPPSPSGEDPNSSKCIPSQTKSSFIWVKIINKKEALTNKTVSNWYHLRLLFNFKIAIRVCIPQREVLMISVYVNGYFQTLVSSFHYYFLGQFLFLLLIVVFIFWNHSGKHASSCPHHHHLQFPALLPSIATIPGKKMEKNGWFTLLYMMENIYISSPWFWALEPSHGGQPPVVTLKLQMHRGCLNKVNAHKRIVWKQNAIRISHLQKTTTQLS